MLRIIHFIPCKWSVGHVSFVKQIKMNQWTSRNVGLDTLHYQLGSVEWEMLVLSLLPYITTKSVNSYPGLGYVSGLPLTCILRHAANNSFIAGLDSFQS